MRMHIGRKVAALGLATLVVGGAAGSAFAAGGGSSSGQSAGTTTTAAADTSAAPALTEMTMTQLTAKLGQTEKQMIIALDDAKNAVVQSKGLTAAGVNAVMVKVLASDLGISGSAAQWAVDEINGGYVPTYVNWGFGS